MSPKPRSGKRIGKTDVDPQSGSLTRSYGSTSTTSFPASSASSGSIVPVPTRLVVSDAQAENVEDSLEQRDYFVTLTVTRASGTYVTLVQLGDSNFPTSYSSQSETPP